MEAWHDFYLVIGGGAAGLTGLMFVVVSLGPKVIATRGEASVRAFISPTVTFFATALVLSALMTAPSVPHALVLAVAGGGGVIYMLAIRVHQQWRRSALDLDDWVWYLGLPLASYILFGISSVGIWLDWSSGIALVGASLTLLLIVGIRNAWDLVLWMAAQT